MPVWLWLGLVAYLLVGLVFALRGRLAFWVDVYLATVGFSSSVPNWKKIAFKWVLRAGIVFFYPIFLFKS